MAKVSVWLHSPTLISFFSRIDSHQDLSWILTPLLFNFGPGCLCWREKAMATHSSTLAWKIPWTEESGRLQSMGVAESDTTERLHFYFSLSCIGEGNGNPLQNSCLENPRDRGAWWAAVCGVAQSRTRLMRLSNRSSLCLNPVSVISNLQAFVKILKFHVSVSPSEDNSTYSIRMFWGISTLVQSA